MLRYRSLLRQIIFIPALFIFCSAAGQTRWTAPADSANVKNPYPGDSAALVRGRTLYNNMCSQCHGYSGKGNGPVAGILNPRPADHTSAAVQQQTDGALFWKLNNGKGQMQPYSQRLSEKDRWNLVSYIHTLK